MIVSTLNYQLNEIKLQPEYEMYLFCKVEKMLTFVILSNRKIKAILSSKFST